MSEMSYSVGGRILDLYDDPSLKLLEASGHLEKVASLPIGDPEALRNLDDRQFGVVFLTKSGGAIRKYPVNDHANVALSNVYFDMTCGQLPPEAKVAAATQIKAACDNFGVAPLPAVLKYAADGSAESSNYVRLDKVRTASSASVDVALQLKEAYVENRDRYSREDRRELALAMDAAGVELPSELRPFAIKNASVDREALFSQCAIRKQLVEDRPEAAGLMDEFLSKHASYEPSEVVRLLETFDRQFDLDSYWTRGLEPNGVLSEKRAMHQVAVRGASFRFTDDELKDFISSHGELVEKMFGKELAEKLRKDPGYAMNLPTASRQFIAARIEHARDNAPAEAF